MVLAIRISKQEKDFGKSISERTGMYMGITDVTAGGKTGSENTVSDSGKSCAGFGVSTQYGGCCFTAADTA